MNALALRLGTRPGRNGWRARRTGARPAIAFVIAFAIALLVGLVAAPAADAGTARFVTLRVRSVPTLALVRQPVYLQLVLREAGEPPRPLVAQLTLTHVATTGTVGPLVGREDPGEPGLYAWSLRLDRPGAYTWGVSIPGADVVREGPFPVITVIESPTGMGDRLAEIQASFAEQFAELQRGIAVFASRAQAAVDRRMGELESRLALAEARARAADERLVEAERQLLELRAGPRPSDAFPVLLVLGALAIVAAVAIRPRRHVRELDLTEQR